MSDDLIKRSDAIGACAYETIECYEARKAIRALPSADRPSGEVDAVKEYEHQVHNLDQGYITLGEFDKRIEPLRHLHYDRPQGEWLDYEIPSEDGGAMPIQVCSLCKTFYPLAYTGGGHRFCPNCGARMKGADDEC